MGTRSPTKPNWTRVSCIVGTREDLTGQGNKRVCRDCGHDVFTDQTLPHDIPILCQTCFAALPAEALGSLPDDPEQLTDAQLLWLCQQHDLRIPLAFSTVQAEAKRRGVEIRVVLREHLLNLLKEAGIA